MVKYASSLGLMTFISTNLSSLTVDLAHNLVCSGLDHLLISVDGATQNGYGAYRKGGNFRKVLDNTELMLATRDRLESMTPVIDWAFIVTRHNEHEMLEALCLSRDIGVDTLYFKRLLPIDSFRSAELPFLRGTSQFSSNAIELASEWLPSLCRYRPDLSKPYLSSKPCRWLWTSMVVNYDGSVSPCCYIDNVMTDMGNLITDDLASIWNGRKYVVSRHVFRTDQPSSGYESTICSSCDYHKRP
jgi:radical SAM protein with 4Fe4S-binding SPASM domain